MRYGSQMKKAMLKKKLSITKHKESFLSKSGGQMMYYSLWNSKDKIRMSPKSDVKGPIFVVFLGGMGHIATWAENHIRSYTPPPTGINQWSMSFWDL